MANIDNAYTVERLSLEDKVLVITHDSDPTMGAGYEAPIGSLLLRNDTSNVYIKYGPLDVEWRLLDADSDLFSEFLQVISEPTGYPTRETSSISFDPGSRTFTIQPLAPATSFDYYIKGIKHTITSAKTVTIPNATNVYFIYFNASEQLIAEEGNVVHFNDLYGAQAVTSIVYYNAVNGTSPYVADERHGVIMDGATHFYLHNTLGTQYINGLSIDGTWTPDAVSPTNANVQINVGNGAIRDEDICIRIYDTGTKVNNSDIEQELSPIAQIPILYKLGSTGIWHIKDADNYPLIYSGTAGYVGNVHGLPPYNKWDGATWSLEEVPHNRYFLVHIFATNDINHPIVGIQGTTAYQNKPSGRDAGIAEITKLTGLPFEEFFPVCTLIFEARSVYTNDVKARGRTTDDGDPYVDWRLTNNFAFTISGGINDHGNLAGLTDDDHPQYALSGSGSTRTFDLSDLYDVTISGELEGQALVYDSATLEWKNQNVDSTYVSYDPSTSVLTSITVQSAIDELAFVGSVINEPTGFPTRATSNISFTDGTRTFNILPFNSPSGFDYYIKGEKFTVTTLKTKQISATEGVHYIYFDTNTTLQETTTFDLDILFRTNAYVAAVYWSVAENKAIYLGDERHGLVMDWATHAYLHQVLGAQWQSGLNLYHFTIGNGTLPQHSQFAVADGRFFDEDLLHHVYDTGVQLSNYDLIQELAPVAQIPIFWIDSDGNWRVKDPDNFPIIYSGTEGYVGANGRLPYNNVVAGTLVQVGQGNYVLTHYFVTNNVLAPIIGVQGQKEYTSPSTAREGAFAEISQISTSGLPFREFVALGTVVWRSSTGDVDPPGGYIVQTAITGGPSENYIDWRTLQITTVVGGNLNDHGSLSGLGDDDHLQYALAGPGSTRTFNLDDLFDVNASTPTTGDVLSFDGTQWSSGPVSDQLVRVSATDTTSGYLQQKLVAGSGISLTQNNISGNETLTVAIAAQGMTYRDEGVQVGTLTRATNFVGPLVTATDAGVVGGLATVNVSVAPNLSIETIGGQQHLCLVDATRGDKKLSVDSSSYTWADTALSNNEWIDIGTSTNTNTGYVMPFSGTVVYASVHCVNNGNGATKAIELYVNETLIGTIISIPAGANVTATNTTANVDFTAGSKLRLRASATGGVVSDTTIVLHVKWRVG